ncbi:MAG: hypothetical protein AB7Q17_16070 [Phycisphaerae bacterium]
MKKIRMAMLALTAGMIAFQFGGCSAGNLLRFLGDLAGDALWLRGID